MLETFNWEMAFVFALLVGAIVSFLLERIPTDQTAATVFGVLLAASALPFSERLPSVEQLLSVFANPAPITIAAMFVLSAALEKCGVIEAMASSLGKLAGLGYRRFLLLLMSLVAVVSAFINNTPVVMVFLPAVLTLARTLGVPASKLLIPLSYASIFGGVCTLVGTSTNILASGILTASGAPPIGMFELAWVGLPLLFLGGIYLTFFADKLLPVRDSLTSLLTPEERKEFVTEAYVQPGSPLVGQTVQDSGLLRGRGVRLLEIVRDAVHESFDDPTAVVLRAGDRLFLRCRPAGLAHARSIDGLALAATRDLGLEAISAYEGSIVEGVIGPRSTLVGQTVEEINFRQRFRVLLLALHRRGTNLRDRLKTVRLESGDLLLFMGTDRAIDGLRRSEDVILLDHPPTPSRSMRRKTPLVVATVAAVIGLAAFDVLPIAGTALVGVALVMAFGVLTPKEGYDSIEWSIMMLIFGMLGLGLAMETTGAAELLARGLVGLASIDVVPEAWAPWVVLAALWLMTTVMTETLSNNATVVLMAPVALSLGPQLGVDPRPFVIATCIAASASFATPIGYQTNTYVYGVAGYRFSDFARIGVPLNLLYFVTGIVLVPMIWPFSG